MGLKNTSQKVKTDKILAVLFVIFTCVTTLLSCYMKNALIFSQSDIYNFFMYITKRVISIQTPKHTFYHRQNNDHTIHSQSLHAREGYQ